VQIKKRIGKKISCGKKISTMANAAATVLRFHSEPAPENCKYLSPVCLRIVGDFEEQANQLMKGANEEIYSSICDFVQNQEFSSTAANSGIPTSLILAGVNMQDHGLAFTEFGTMLKERTNCAIACLQPSQCKTLDLCLDSLFQQFAASNTKCRVPSGISFSMSMLKSWFKESSHQMLVVLIQQVESFPPQVLADLISVCWNNSRSFDRAGLPFLFLLSMSTSQHSIQKLLPTSSSNKLQVDAAFVNSI
jgi:hypothetical protein